MQIIKEIEDYLCNLTGRDYTLFTGRASSALYAYLISKKEEIVETREYILIPSILCNSVPNTIVKAGYKPLFIDINLEDYNLSIESFEKTMNDNENKIAGIIAPHLYGHALDHTKIQKITQDFGIFLIEDAAQIIPNKDNSNIGKIGEMSIMSFGHTKPIEIGGGGCMSTDNKEIYSKCKKILQKAPIISDYHKLMAKEYNKLYYLIKNAELNGLSSFQKFKYSFPDVFSDLYFYNHDVNLNFRELLLETENMEELIKNRRIKAEIYRKNLDEQLFIHPTYKEGTVPWRYTFRVETNSEHFANKIREMKIDASSWYPPLTDWFQLDEIQKSVNLKNAKILSKQVVNLWLDESISSNQIDINSRKIREIQIN
ncbi:MAG: DegT/DnrJ/EryC1/StrS family aminotransferase [Candidatus Heimdallarchaeaceae archaeon]